MVRSFFAYGTLKRGECRESLWPAEPEAVRPAVIHGTLLGRADYPALLPGHDFVAGQLWTFLAADLPMVMTALDHIEGTNGNVEMDLYHRHTVEVMDLAGNPIGQAYAYFYNRDVIQDGFQLISPKNGFCQWTANRSPKDV